MHVTATVQPAHHHHPHSSKLVSSRACPQATCAWVQGGLQDDEVSDALLLSSQRLEAERAIFQKQLQAAFADVDARDDQVRCRLQQQAQELHELHLCCRGLRQLPAQQAALPSAGCSGLMLR